MSAIKSDQKFILLSVLLHGLVASTLLFQWSRSQTPFGFARRGSAVVEFTVPTSLRAAPAVVAPVKARPVVTAADGMSPANSKLAEIKPAPAAATTSQSQLGFANGVPTTGPLGREDGTANSERDRYLYELRVLIEQKKVYPQVSRRLREMGRVVVSFQVLKDGRIEAVDLKSGSSYARLNEAALGLVKGIAKFKPFPQELANDQLSLEIPIEYVLN